MKKDNSYIEYGTAPWVSTTTPPDMSTFVLVKRDGEAPLQGRFLKGIPKSKLFKKNRLSIPDGLLCSLERFDSWKYMYHPFLEEMQTAVNT